MTLRAAQTNNTDKGGLQIQCTSEVTNRPIPNCTVRIYTEGNTDTPFEVLTTDVNGRTPTIDIPCPPLEFSMQPEAEQPYAVCIVEVEQEEFETLYINGTQILSEQVAIQECSMIPRVSERTAERIVIPEHTLYGDYPPKIAENEIKDISETGEIVLSRAVIPEFVVVHDGPPSDRTAKDYYVKYKDYIKNVVSSEIYSTWPTATIVANTLAIMSFTLNRVYTEWYRNRGYSFTITNSTAYDQKWIYGRNIFSNVSTIVDSIFVNYLAKPGVVQPLFTQYCDGKNVTCPNWLSQWGSKYLGDQGYSAIEIIRNYYGRSLYIASANEISGIPSSWPGYNLTRGSSGSKVRQLQQQLNVVASAYPLIPRIAADGIYGSNTANAVKVFQSVFGLNQTGITDFPTWYKISEIFVAVSRIADTI